eukprot:TRINITY_DN770_c0_g1_i1.p1 TRINITY_DN770_c0_g1~~TRINITY_DN770_c0_g1_i1.p1  ORF type:complete len:778 (+),score=200.17 TRINITY_DN770_c0_g1_i1:259-2334(+)
MDGELILTKKGKDAKPRFDKPPQHTETKITPRELVEKKKLARERMTMAYRDKKVSGRSMDSPPSKPPTPTIKASSRHMAEYNRLRDAAKRAAEDPKLRSLTPRGRVEIRREEREKQMVALREKETNPRDRRSRSATPSRRQFQVRSKYLDAAEAKAEEGKMKREKLEKEHEKRERSRSVDPSRPRSKHRRNWSIGGSSGVTGEKDEGVLSPGEIMILRSIKVPSEALQLAFRVLCIMFSMPPILKTDPKSPQGRKVFDYIEPCRNLMLHPSLLRQKIANFDESSVSLAGFKKIRRCIRNPCFDPSKIGRTKLNPVSKLVAWTIEMGRNISSHLGEDPSLLDQKYPHRPNTPPPKVVEMIPVHTISPKHRKDMPSSSFCLPSSAAQLKKRSEEKNGIPDDESTSRRSSVKKSKKRAHYSPERLANESSFVTPVSHRSSVDRSRPVATSSIQKMQSPKIEVRAFPRAVVPMVDVADVKIMHSAGVFSPELFRRVSAFLDEPGLCMVSRTCRLFYTYTLDPSVWSDLLQRRIARVKTLGKQRLDLLNNVQRIKENAVAQAAALNAVDLRKLSLYARPPLLVDKVMRGLFLLLRIESPENWGNTDADVVVKAIRNFKMTTIPYGILRQFDKDGLRVLQTEVAEVSQAALGFHIWISYIMDFHYSVREYEKIKAMHVTEKSKQDRLRGAMATGTAV